MINAIKRGDAFAFEQAYIEHREKVYFYLKKKTKSQEDAKDLLQNVFFKLWQYRQSLSTDYLLEQHLFQIARTVFIDYLRKQNKSNEFQKTINYNQLNTTYTVPAVEFDITNNLQSVLLSMPNLRKRIFELNRLQGYSYKEIAEILCIPVKCVDNNLTKALKQLRKLTFLILLIAMCIL